MATTMLKMRWCTKPLSSAFHGSFLSGLFDVMSSQKLCTQVRQLSSSKLMNFAIPAADVQVPQSKPSSHEQSTKVVDPLQHPDFFEVNKMFTMGDLFAAKVHLGHKTGLLNAHMKKYIFGVRQKVCVFDLRQTVEHLRLALNVTAHIAYREGIIMFVSRSLQFTHLVERTAQECGEFAHTRYWQGGCFTNALKQYGPETKLPDLIILLSTQNNVFQEHTAVRDAAKMNIPTVSVVDSSSNPNLITYPVPGNDDTPEAVELYCRLFKEAVLKGKQARLERSGKNTAQ